MAQPQIRTEDGIIYGNITNKYHSKNPIVNYLMGRFKSAVADLVTSVSPSEILEVGCGEGHVTSLLAEHTSASIVATDFSMRVLEEARQTVKTPRVAFQQASIYELSSATKPAPLIVCCEVLEHLENPQRGLEQLAKVTTSYCLLSVPCEPLWRILNLARGAYVTDLGNTPGHLQHWSARTFVRLIDQYFDVVEVRRPLPWTVVLARHKRQSAKG